MSKDDAKSANKNWKLRTRMVRGATNRSSFGETSEAMFLTSGYVYDSPEQAEARFKGEDEGFIYSRYDNPTVDMFERRMALIEGAEAAKATASGMAAVNAALTCQVKSGDHIVAAKALFGSSLYILQDILGRFGVAVTLIDGTDLNAWRDAMRDETRCLFIETPTNPTLDVIDIAAVAEIAHSKGARLIVDNVFASPVLQHPLELGADIVVYSATKHIDGQGRCLGGVVLGSTAFIEDELAPFLRHTGPSLSPFNAWVMLKGLETLDLRFREHCRNAAAVADFLKDAGGIARTIYPGHSDHPQHDLAMKQMDGCGGPMVAFEIEGGKDAAFRFLNALDLIDISNNLGDAKTLITHPTTTTHQRLAPELKAELGITDSLLRLSVGLEDASDIIADIQGALAAV